MTNPKFSIIIPNYNKGKLIKNCLDSIFNQNISRDKYEVIVIDDGSTDNSLEFIYEYDITLLKSNRLGAGGARNKGMEIAKGEYIILLDSDDFFADNNQLSNLSKSLNNEDIVFVRYIEDNLGQKKFIKENLYVYYKPNSNSTIDNYSVRKAIDFLDQTIEYFYFADKYTDKKESILKRIDTENYHKKIERLYDWVKNDNKYTYKEYLK